MIKVAKGTLHMSASAEYGAKRSAPVPAQQRSEQRKHEAGKSSEQAYIARLRRSIKQMKNGEVQPVREGLEELRHEIDADAEDNSVDQ